MQYPCAGQGGQPCPVSGVSPLSTGYYLRINEAGQQQSCFDFLDNTQKEMEEKPLRLTRHNGRSGKNGAYNPKHNDRRFDLENSEHIDAKRAKRNIYWDCYRGITTSDNRNADAEQDLKSFLSRQKETYKIPYDKQPDDRLFQCVFGGTSNTLDFLPLDSTGNRRFLPIMVYPERSEVHIMEDEKVSRAYIGQMWAEAMVIYRSKKYQLSLSKEMEQYLKEFQKQFMPEDTKAGMIQGFLDRYKGNMVCSKMLYKEALNHPFDEPKQWEIREINDIMNNSIVGWKQFTNPRHFAGYGRQKGWERHNQPVTTGTNPLEGFVELTEEEAKQRELPLGNTE